MPDTFKMLVPVYLEFADGKIALLGSATMAGNATNEKTIQLPKFSAPIKKVTINNNFDVLCSMN